MDDEAIAAILAAIAKERVRATEKWPDDHYPPLYWVGIIGEEFGEICTAAIGDGGPQDYLDELIHTAASCVRAAGERPISS